MLNCNSALLAIASEFVGRYSPYQSIQISPASYYGGVYFASTDGGKISCLAYDPSGSMDDYITLLPNSELIKASRGVKTASRTLSIETDSQVALVTTHRKTTSESKEIPVTYSSVEFPDLAGALKDCIKRWKVASSATAGRYDINYVQRAIKSLSSINSSVTLHSFDGGPMRIQEETGNIVILVMPQTAEPIPPIPDWLKAYSQDKMARGFYDPDTPPVV